MTLDLEKPEMATVSISEPENDQARPEARTAIRRTSVSFVWLFLFIGLTLGSVAMFVLATPYSFILLLALVVIGAGLCIYDAGETPASIVRETGQTLNRAQRLIGQTRTISSDAAADRSRLIIGFSGAACVLMALSAFEFRPTPDMPDRSLDGALIFMALGAVSLGVAMLLASPDEVLAAPAAIPLIGNRPKWGLTTAGVILFLILAEISGKALNIEAFTQISIHAQYAMFWIAVILVAWGLSGWQVTLSRRFLAAGRDYLRSVHWRELLPVAAIFALSLALRLWNVDTAIPMPIDEEHFIITSSDVNWTPNKPLLDTALGDLIASPSIYPYAQYWAIQAFGHNLFGLRFVSAVVGSLTVIALYALARALFDDTTAIIAALVLATFPPHMHFSRLALYAVGDTFFGTLALAFLALGLKHNQRAYWVLAGVSLGLTHYFYEPGRLTFTPLVILCIVFLALAARGHLRTHWHGVAIMTLAFLFLAAPVYYTLIAVGKPLATRFNQSGLGVAYWTDVFKDGVTIEKLQMIAAQFTRPFEIYIHLPETKLYFYYYGGNQAMVLSVFVPLFLLGVFYVFWRWRTPAIILLFWLILPSLGGGLMKDSTVYVRYVIVFPVVAMFLAVAIRFIPPLLWADRRWTTIFVPTVALLTAVTLGSVVYYFGSHLHMFRVQASEYTEAPNGYDAILRAAQYPDDVQAILISNPQHDESMLDLWESYLRSSLLPDTKQHTVSSDDLTDSYVASLPKGRSYAFFVARDDRKSIELLNQYFNLAAPEGSPYDIPPSKEFLLYYGTPR